jgi:hypothetical protein
VSSRQFCASSRQFRASPRPIFMSLAPRFEHLARMCASPASESLLLPNVQAQLRHWLARSLRMQDA